jgi:uncharacterized membrane protein YjgN (DUF898 family)
MTPPGRQPVDPLGELAGLWGPPAAAPPRPPGPPAAPPPPASPPDGPPAGARAAAPPPEAPGGPLHGLVFHGSGGSLFGIFIVNMLLTLVTLGVFHFWAKTRVRRYFASETEFEGDRFAYHGTGVELLVGALKATVIFAVPFAIFRIVPQLDLDVFATAGAIVLAYAIVLLLIPLAIVGTQRYRLSRTSWRGIRFSFRGPTAEFVRLFVGGALLSVVTLGIYYPFFLIRRQTFLVSHSYFGSERFGFDGQGRELFRIYLVGVLLLLPTLGLYWFWFQARRQRYLWGRTTTSTARFRYPVTGGALFALRLVNAILLVLTLGLATPWVAVRNTRFAYRYLGLEGPLDLERVQQEAQLASATGEGLAGFLDTGFEFEW